MSDITITDGLPEAWTLANTDKLKLDEANLINLAVGQLALLGASQGTVLREQTLKLQELIGGVDKVNAQLDFLNNVNSTPTLWSGNSSLGIPDEAVNWKTQNASYLLATDIAIVDKLIAATSKFIDQGKTSLPGGGGVIAYRYKSSITNEEKYYVTKTILTASTKVGAALPLTLKDVDFGADAPSVDKLETGQIIILKSDTGNNISTSYHMLYAGKLVDITNKYNLNGAEGFLIPQSATELQSWQMLASGNAPGKSSLDIAIGNSATLSSNIELAPNTLPPSEPPRDPEPTNAVVMSIDAGTAFDAAKYFLNNSKIVYTAYPPLQVKAIDNTVLISANVGKVVQVGKDAAEYIYVDKYGVVKTEKVDKYENPFFYKPSQDQINNWKSQYPEKIIVITQRSSDQQLFVTNLAQKYQYAFDAATYVLKAFTTMLNSAANNI